MIGFKQIVSYFEKSNGLIVLDRYSFVITFMTISLQLNENKSVSNTVRANKKLSQHGSLERINFPLSGREYLSKTAYQCY